VLQHARSIISRNDSPDIGFEQSINPYQGCEHGCVYCYARPSHAYLDLSPGIDFETKLFAKVNAAELLREELSRPKYKPSVIALGANTDPYQPAERKLGITRSVLEVLSACNLPTVITTKSGLVTRDIDVLASMAKRGLVRVYVSITSLDSELARTLEPRASSPSRRLQTIEKLAASGIPVGVFASPIIPAINDRELEHILERSAASGARHAGYVVLRLPREVRDLFVEWLNAYFPMRSTHVMSLVAEMHGGRDYDPSFGTRMRGTGHFADLLFQRFRLAAKRNLLNMDRKPLDTRQFVSPFEVPPQRSLFD